MNPSEKVVRAMGERLQVLRKGKGFSQSELAQATGIPVGSIKNWEQGIRLPRLDLAYRLAQAMGISLDVLAGEVFKESAPKKGPRKKGKGE